MASSFHVHTRRGTRSEGICTLPFAPTPMEREAGAPPASLPFLKFWMGTGSSPFQPGNLSVSSMYRSVLLSCQNPTALHDHRRPVRLQFGIVIAAQQCPQAPPHAALNAEAC